MKESPKYSAIFGFLKPFLWDNLGKKLKFNFIISLIFLLFAKFLTLITPIIFGRTIDSLSISQQNYSVTTLFIVLLIFSYGLSKVLSLAFNELKDSLFSSISQSATREISLIVFKHLHSLSLNFHLKRNTGALARFIDRGTKGVDFLLRYVVFNILPILIEVLLICLIFSLMFGVFYSLVTLFTIIIYIITTLKITQWRIKYRKELNKADNNVSNTIIESLINFETVKYFDNETHEVSKLNQHLKDYESNANKNRYSLSFLNISQNIIIMTGIVVLMTFSGVSVRAGNLTIGDFVIINTYLLQLYQPLNFLGSVYREIRQSIVDMENMFNLLNEKNENTNNSHFKYLKTSHFVEFKNISFSYDNKRKILKNINLKINQGERIALVGPTGSGKTTIFRLLYKFYEIFDGDIFIDGKNIKEISKKNIRQILGIIPQDIVLFNNSILYNISYGNLKKSENHIIDAAKKANIHSFVNKLPLKYKTIVGERGLKLSGGEKQRIAIARTILKNPKILLLDEASSSLDLKTEQQIQKNLEKISKSKTIITIAHRLTSVKNYDKIYYLENGKILESGNHKSLMKLSKGYYKMWNFQNSKL